MICFYEVSSPNSIAATTFQLGNNISQANSKQISYKQNDQPGYFKSAINNDKTQILICYSKNGQGGNCIIYNVMDNSFSEDMRYLQTCTNNPKAIHVDYFSETKEFIFSCNDGGIFLTIIKFDDNGNAINYNNSLVQPNFEFGGNNLFSYSIIFLPINSKYSLLVTSTSYDSNQKYCNQFSLPDIFDHEDKEGNLQTQITTIIEEGQADGEYETNNFVENATELSVHNLKTELNEESEAINNSVIYEECSSYEKGDIKCLFCNEESLKINKCIKCNNELGYYPIKYNDNDDKYEQCYNNNTKLNNFYFDSYSKSYKLC